MENSGCLFKKTEHLLGSHTQAQGGGDLCSKQLALMPLVNMYGMNEDASGRITGVTQKVLET